MQNMPPLFFAAALGLQGKPVRRAKIRSFGNGGGDFTRPRNNYASITEVRGA
jgi:hypothetical protein